MLEKYIKYCEKVVDRLIMQYFEYEFLNQEIKRLESERFNVAIKIAKKSRKKVNEILKNGRQYRDMDLNSQTIELYKIDLDKVSNEMTYANPLVWMMYKYKAYKNTSNEIKTLGDFRKHCSPEGYTCTQRYRFLRSYTSKNKIDIDDHSKYDDDLELSEFYLRREILDLLNDNEFMRHWKEKEYQITGNKINKWNTKDLE